MNEKLKKSDNEKPFLWSRWPVLTTIFTFWIFLMAEGISGTAGMHRVDEVKRAFRGFGGRYVLYVSKGEFRLYVYNRRGRVVTQYPVGYGLNPDRRPKLHEGDSRTPEGCYRVVQVLSMDANKKTAAYKKLKELNDRYLRAEDGHFKFGQPDVDTGRNAYGPRLFWIDYPNEKDRENYEEAVKRGLVPMVDGKVTGIGYGITIHGNNDPPSVGELSTAGCIIMYNKDIRALHKYVRVGTPVIISAD